MTGRSWSRLLPGAGWGKSRLVPGIIVAWHAGCILFGTSGCFVTWDVPYAEPENLPPEFTSLTVEDGGLITMNDTFPFFAAAQDPDSDGQVVFVWQAGGRILFDDPQQFGDGDSGSVITWGSSVEVPYDPLLNGKTLLCTVYDDEGDHIDASWPLEVL